MVGFKFIHTADLHLDFPFQGIGQIDEKIQKRLITSGYRVLENLVNLCIREDVDFLLIAGDLYDGANLSLKAQLRYREAFQRLYNHQIQVFVVHGNHDHCGGWRADLVWPEGVHFFSSSEVESCPVIKDGQEVARVYGISYPTQAVHENYLPRFKIQKESPYHIGLLHTNVGGSSGYANYAPCSLDELVSSGFDYWALGHVHSYQVLHHSNPVVIYPGTPQGRHPGETGPKGCCLVEVDSFGETHHQWIELDDVRWANLQVNIGGLASLDDLFIEIQNSLTDLKDRLVDRSGLVRLKLTGRGLVHDMLNQPGVEQDILEMFRFEEVGTSSWLWIESVQIETAFELNLDEIRKEESLRGDFLKLTQKARNLEGQNEIINDLRTAISPVINDRRFKKILSKLDEDTWQRLIDVSEELGIDLLGSKGE